MPNMLTKTKRTLQTAAIGVLVLLAVVVVFADFLAPYDYASQVRSLPSAPPTSFHFFDQNGQFHFRPFVYGHKMINSLSGTYAEDLSSVSEVGLFVDGPSYRFLGIIPVSTHLFGLTDASKTNVQVNLLGTDVLGRDRFSRLLIAIRFSLIVCPLGALLAWLIGMVIGLISGYAGRDVDTAIMGVADTMLALPTLIIILAARAAFPLELPPMRAATLLIIIFAVTGWAEIARLTRGLVRSLKEREFILAARSIGLSESRILFRHLLPNVLPSLIAQAVVILPYFLLSEVALSFLGVGLQEPQPSLGNMLTTAADLNQLGRNPSLVLTPAFVITLFVIAISIVSQNTKARRF